VPPSKRRISIVLGPVPPPPETAALRDGFILGRREEFSSGCRAGSGGPEPPGAAPQNSRTGYTTRRHVSLVLAGQAHFARPISSSVYTARPKYCFTV